jgi:hypothetical protein
MNIYKLTRNDDWGYDDYDSLIVIAENEESAKLIPPITEYKTTAWPNSPNLIDAELIGTAKEGSVAGCVLASFNAG